MLSSSKIVLALDQVIIKVSGNEHQWLTGGYDLEIGHFCLEVDNMVVSWWIVALLPSEIISVGRGPLERRSERSRFCVV